MDRNEILRYLGAPSANGELEAMICRGEREISAAAVPRHLLEKYPIEVTGGGVRMAGAEFASRDLAAHLRGCQEAYFLALTLGPGVDSLIRRYELTELAMVPVLQACAAACVEEQADSVQKELELREAERGLYLRPRYSPGYGDFPLADQKKLFSLLEIPKRLGVSLTDSFLMVPMKSITAVIGLSGDPSLCHTGKCMTCSAQNCPFRKDV